MKYIVIAEKIGVLLPNSLDAAPIKYITDEFRDFLQDSFDKELIAEISTNHTIANPFDATLLLDGRLYIKDNVFYVQSGGTWFTITPKLNSFQICVSPMSDGVAVAGALEALLNYYMPIYGLTFLHTASYIIDSKVCAIHAFGGSGKSETMLHALYNGADFISDDLAVFNIEGQIYPYPRKISLHGYEFTDEELERYSLNKSHYKRLQWLKAHPGRITNRLYERWKREFYIRFRYYDVTGCKTLNRFYDVSTHYWLEAKGKTFISELNHDFFVQRMKFCMQNEFCSYINYNGYFEAVLPFWKTIQKRYSDCLNLILDKIKIKGASIDNIAYSDMQKLIKEDMKYISIGNTVKIQVSSPENTPPIDCVKP